MKCVNKIAKCICWKFFPSVLLFAVFTTSEAQVHFNSSKANIGIQQGTYLSVGGNFKIDTSSLNNQGTIQLMGDWVNNSQVTTQQEGVCNAWTQRYSGPDSLDDGALAIDDDGCLYVGGVSYTPTGINPVIIKYDRNGTFNWASSYTNEGEALVRAIAVGENCGIYATGYVTNDTIGAAGGRQFIVLKYDSLGEFLWEYRLPLRSEAFSMTLDLSGNVYVTGYAFNNVAVPIRDMVIVKLSSSGEELWVNYFDNNNGDDFGADAVVDASGNVYLTGMSLDTATQIASYITIKYNSSGTLVWNDSYLSGISITNETNGEFAFNSSHILISGSNLYVSGSVAISTADYLLIKYDTNGDTVWTYTFDGAANNKDFIRDITLATDGGIIIAGNELDVDYNHISSINVIKVSSAGEAIWETNSFGICVDISGDPSGNVYLVGGIVSGSMKILTIKYDSNGIQQWTKVNGGLFYDIGTAVKAVANDEVYVAGYSNGNDFTFDFVTIKYASGDECGQSASIQAGDIELTGNNDQRLRGVHPINFNNIKLHGTGRKKMESDVSVDGVLNLRNSEFATQNYTLTINNSDPAAILRDTGFVSSDSSGKLVRKMNDTVAYIFPLASKEDTFRYRPIEIAPTSLNEQSFSARFINHSPDLDGFDVNSMDSSIEEVNFRYYHKVERISGNNEPINCTIYFNADEDLAFHKVAMWNGNNWEKINNSSTFILPAPILSQIKLFNFFPIFPIIITPIKLIPIGTNPSACPVDANGGPVLTWTGNIDNDFSNSQNWSPTQVPNSISNIVIVAPLVQGNYPVLNSSATVNNVCMLSGEANLNGQILTIYGDAYFKGGTVNSSINVSLDISRLYQVTLFEGTTFDIPITVRCSEIYLNGSRFNKISEFKLFNNNKQLNNLHSKGGNIYDERVIIENQSSTVDWYLADEINGLKDEYRNDVTYKIYGPAKIFPTGRFADIFLGNVNLSSSGDFNYEFIFGINGGVANFEGSVLQKIARTASLKIIFKKMKINKDASNVELFNTPITVGNNTGDFLELIKGNIITTGNNLLNIANNAIVIGASDLSYVNGPVKKIGSQEFIFPTGKSGKYLPIKISAPAVSTDEFTAEYFNIQQPLGTAPADLSISTCEYWTLTRNNGSSIVDVSIGWNQVSCDIPSNPATARVVGWSGTSWVDHGNQNFFGSPIIGQVTSSEIINSYQAFVLGIGSISELPTEGTTLNNFGVHILVKAGYSINVHGNILNTVNSSSVGGLFDNDGNIRLTKDWVNNGSNDAFSSGYTGLTEMIGAYQRIKGTTQTKFYNLTLSGNGKKEMFISSGSNGILNLTHNELATRNNIFYVYNSSSGAITKDNTLNSDGTGFVSSIQGGSLARNMAEVAEYVFPVGSSDIDLRYRPVSINPSTAAAHQYRVRMVNKDPVTDVGSSKSSSVSGINDKYYHVINQNSGTDPAIVKIYFDKANDGQYQGIGHWDDQDISPVYFPPDAPLWKNTNTGCSTAVDLTSIYSALNSVSVGCWDDFMNQQFALIQAGFVINTNGFGDPDDNGTGVTYTVTGTNFTGGISGGGNGTTYGTGVGYPGDNTEGETITPDGPVSGTYTVNVNEDINNTGGSITFEVDDNGNINEGSFTFTDNNGVTNPLSEDVVTVTNGNILVINSSPPPLVSSSCDINSIRIMKDNTNPLILESTFDIDGLVASDINQLRIYPVSSSTPIVTKTGTEAINTPWNGSGATPGPYRFELEVNKSGGGVHVFKGQFIIQ